MTELRHGDLNRTASHLLASAFADDPWIRRLFQGDPIKTQYFFQFILKYCEGSGGRILIEHRGTEAEDKTATTGSIETIDRLASVACLEYPATGTSPTNMLHLMKAFLHFIFQCGFKPLGMVNDYMRLTTSHRPKERHHYLICIGVDPRLKGKGIGKSMLNAIHRIVDEDPSSIGIGLDTENAHNVALYEHFGYGLTGTETLDGITIYTMFRPSPGQKLQNHHRE